MKKVIEKSLFIIILATLLCVVLLPVNSYAEDEGGYMMWIEDNAELLTEEEEEILYDNMEGLLDYGNVFFSTQILSEGESYEGYSEDLYYEYFGNEPGVHFMIDMGNRKLVLSASTGMEDLIGKERESIVDNIYTLATDKDYLGCAIECFDEILIVINDGKIAHKMKYIDNAIIALIIGIILNFMLVFSTKKKKASPNRILEAVAITSAVAMTSVNKGNLVKEYSPSNSSSSGGSSGGGGGGGGFSGGSSSHGF